MNWMLMPLRRYADFSGRSQRQEFWMFFLFQTMINIGIFILMLFSAGTMALTANGANLPASATNWPVVMPVIILGGLWLIFILAMIVPNAAVAVRRCHDQNLSGWVGGTLYALTFLMNLVGLTFLNIFGLLLLILMCMDGTRGPNNYGADPKERDMGDIFS